MPVTQTEQRITLEVDNIRTIAQLHSLALGSPECLVALPLRLAQDRGLRVNLVEHLRELQRADPEFSLPDALQLILTAVGGSQAIGRRPDLEEAVDLTAGFLASIGGWPTSSTEPITDLDNPPDHDPRFDLRNESAADLVSPNNTALNSEPSTSSQDPVQTSASEAATLSQITRTLVRLERSTVDLKIHLDSIDQRLSRMEPLLESPPGQRAPNPTEKAPVPSSPSQAAPRDLVHRHDPSPITPPTPQAAPAPPAAVPTTPLLHRRDRFSAALDLPGAQLSGAQSAPPVESQSTSPLDRRQVDAASQESSSAAPPQASPQTPNLRPPSPSPQQPPSAQAGSAAHPPSLAAPPLRANSGEIKSNPRDVTVPARPLSFLAEQLKASAAVKPTASPDPQEAASPEHPAPATPRHPEAASSPIPTSIHTPEPHSNQAPISTPVPRPPFAVADAGTEQRTTRPEEPHPDRPGFTFAGAAPEESDPAQSRRTIVLLGIFSALMVALSLFLLLRDKPLRLLLTSPSTHRPTTPAAAPPPSSSSSPPNDLPRQNTTPLPSETHRTATAEANSPAPVPNRVLGARAADEPRVSEEVFAAPTPVPESVMKARLVAAPTPLYPQLPNGIHPRGEITFDAIISKAGAVDGLTPLSGERLLRDAAANAVREWRFQPYLMKGKPVQVQTILHVRVEPQANAR